MKLKKYIIMSAVALSLSSCHDLDLNPLSSGSTENWYSTEKELEMAVNDLYSINYWPQDGQNENDWSDDSQYRNTTNAFNNATLDGQNQFVVRLWQNQYKAIAHANAIIAKQQHALDCGVAAQAVNRMVAEAKFHRAAAYSKLVFKFGDVPLVLEPIALDKAFQTERTPKAQVLTQIYKDFDEAAAELPAAYPGTVRATKGAALAFKARIALQMSDWAVAAAAAKAVIDLGVYDLHADYGQLFLPATKVSKEFVFKIPRSLNVDQWKLGDHVDAWGWGANVTYNNVVRNAGGWGARTPSWDLMASYTCTDGKPVDESPLFDSHNPFENRDPRLSMTIVPFGSTWLGIEFNPSPAAEKVYDYNKGKEIVNNDSRINAQYASFNGMYWKKGIDESWTQNGWRVDADLVCMRYADVLLMYAEAMIEQNKIDDSVVAAMNKVRARAYGVDASATDSYPAFTKQGQAQMRYQLRVERRMELAGEGMRYSDLIRWRLAEVVNKRKNYGMLYPAADCLEKIVKAGEWFWAFAPEIDANGCPDFSKLEAAGKIMSMSERAWDNRQYLWPIPTNELLINEKMQNNPGY